MWLRRSHPNFFIVFSATLMFHAAQALIGLAAGAGSFRSASLTYVNDVATPGWWGAAFGVTALGMAAGLASRRWWHAARLALAWGAVVTGVRAVLIAMAALKLDGTGLTGVPLWLLAAILHLSQAGEPPANPASGRA